MRIRSWLALITVIICLIFWILKTIPQFYSPMISSEDGYSRLASGVAWSSPTTRYPINYVWPPLTSNLYSIPYLAYPFHQYISIRIFSWLLILITIVVIGLITWEVSKNIFATAFAISFSLVNPLLINLSTQTLSENIWLPFVGLSLLFLVNPNKKYWGYGYFFWSVSQACRYESWYLIPIVVTIFWYYHKNLRATLSFLGYSLVFPIYWYLETLLATNNYRFYLDEKLFQAKHGSPYIYHHFFASSLVWIKQLGNSHSIPIILAFIFSIRTYIKKRNLLFILPIFIFVSLILQVYFATMEISPARYIALLPLIIIPLSVSYVYSLPIGALHQTMILSAILVVELITNSQKIVNITEFVYPEQIQVGNFISHSRAPCISYLKANQSPRFDNSAFWYFSQQPMTNVVFVRSDNPFQIDKPLPDNCYTIVVEKTLEHPVAGEKMPTNFGAPIYENKYFQVYEPTFMKNQSDNAN